MREWAPVQETVRRRNSSSSRIAEKKDCLSSVSANTNLIIRNSNIVRNPSEEYVTLANIEDRANAVFNLLLKKSKTIPNFAPDLYTQSVKYTKM